MGQKASFSTELAWVGKNPEKKRGGLVILISAAGVTWPWAFIMAEGGGGRKGGEGCKIGRGRQG